MPTSGHDWWMALSWSSAKGIAPLKALKNGLQSLDHPKLIGVVVNEASEFDQIDYDGQYYGAGKDGDKRSEKLR